MVVGCQVGLVFLKGDGFRRNRSGRMKKRFGEFFPQHNRRRSSRRFVRGGGG